MKALGLVVLDKKIFENCIMKTYFFTPTTGMVRTTLVEDHPRILPMKFCQNPMMGSRGDV